MLQKFSSCRTQKDNIRLGTLTAFSAGMVNVCSFIIFFAFTSNVTGHYAILAEEIAKGHWHQVGVVFGWIFVFFLGNFISNFIIIHYNTKNVYLAHAFPLLLEIICLLSVGIYGEFFYKETLRESELLVSIMLLAMGIQNGLTASISNFAIKTTHLTGLTTDLGILCSMFTKAEYRENPDLRNRAKLLAYIATSYLCGGVIAGFIYLHLQFKVYFIVCIVLGFIVLYDWSNLRIKKYMQLKTKAINTGKIMERELVAEKG